MRLNAPARYRWQNEDVIFEKKISWYDGFLIGLALATTIFVVVFLVAL